ncbi:MAG TPA: HEAT repeat domain-containing protein, partial [Gemmatimonadales bacterium]|nr:HEAT repeat domain-containing protein [Gemmatimonadales bacterium]
GAPSQPAAPRQSMVQRAALPRELSDFLIEFSIALHKHSMYPDGHPTLGPSSDAVARRLDTLLAERGTLSLGVAREQLVIEGVATDPKHPVLKDLADRLHRHHLGAISFARGVVGSEIDESLKLLAVDAGRGGGEPLGMQPLGKIAAWPHIRLYPLTFDRLQLLEGGDGEEEPTATPGATKAAQLWVGLARAALASEDVGKPTPEPKAAGRPAQAGQAGQGAQGGASAPLSDAEIDAALDAVQPAAPMEAAAAEPSQVARAIEGHERGTAYDQVIVGYMLQIADELKVAGGSGAVALKKRMSKLIGALDKQTLARLLEMGGDRSQRRQFILDASQGMAVDAVVDLVQAASGTGAPVSRSMLRMLTKLGHHAERGPAASRVVAEVNLREQVAELVRGWALADPNPEGYAAALEKMSQVAPALVAPGEAQFEPEPERLVQMACEIGASGGALGRAMDHLVLGNRLADALDVLEQAPQASAATEALGARLVTPEVVRAMLAAQPPDFVLLDRVLPRLGDAAAEPMLDLLAESESRQVRRALIDRLIRIGPALGPHLLPRLGDERWYVVRNLLYLAAELPAAPAGLNAAQYAQHADLRVRREALRVLFREPAVRTRAICTALADEDARVKRLALSAVADGGCPEAAVPLVVALATGDEESELRVAAIRALGAEGGRLSLDALLRITQLRRSLLGGMRRGFDEPEFLAALAALGEFLPDRRARERLEQAALLKDPSIMRVTTEALKGGT